MIDALSTAGLRWAATTGGGADDGPGLCWAGYCYLYLYPGLGRAGRRDLAEVLMTTQGWAGYLHRYRYPGLCATPSESANDGAGLKKRTKNPSSASTVWVTEH